MHRISYKNTKYEANETRNGLELVFMKFYMQLQWNINNKQKIWVILKTSKLKTVKKRTFPIHPGGQRKNAELVRCNAIC